MIFKVALKKYYWNNETAWCFKGKGLKEGETTVAVPFQCWTKFPHTNCKEVNSLFPLAAHIPAFHVTGKCDSQGAYTRVHKPDTWSIIALLSRWIKNAI